MSYNSHTEHLCKDLRILNLQNILSICSCIFTPRVYFTPNSFRKMFTLTNQVYHIKVYSYKTRNSNSFYTFPYRTIIRKFLIGFQGPKFFDSLPLKDIFFNSDDQAIYCNKLTQRGGGGSFGPPTPIDFPNGCR